VVREFRDFRKTVSVLPEEAEAAMKNFKGMKAGYALTTLIPNIEVWTLFFAVISTISIDAM